MAIYVIKKNKTWYGAEIGIIVGGMFILKGGVFPIR